MAVADIEVNAVGGSPPAGADDVVAGALVQLSNNDDGDEVTYAWAILDQPEGATDALSSAVIENPTFTPTREGSYLVELVVDATLPSESRDTVLVAVEQVLTRERIPAAGETTEAQLSRGWAERVNRQLRRSDLEREDTFRFIGRADNGGLTTGQLAVMTGSLELLTGLPGERNVIELSRVVCTDDPEAGWDLAYVELKTNDMDGEVPAADDVYARTIGLVTAGISVLETPAVDDDVYLDAFGDMTTVAPVTGLVRIVGRVIGLDGSGNGHVWFDGSKNLAAGGGGGGSLQAAYDGGTTVDTAGGAAVTLRNDTDTTLILQLDSATAAALLSLTLNGAPFVSFGGTGVVAIASPTTVDIDGAQVALGATGGDAQVTSSGGNVEIIAYTADITVQAVEDVVVRSVTTSVLIESVADVITLQVASVPVLTLSALGAAAVVPAVNQAWSVTPTGTGTATTATADGDNLVVASGAGSCVLGSTNGNSVVSSTAGNAVLGSTPLSSVTQVVCGSDGEILFQDENGATPYTFSQVGSRTLADAAAADVYTAAGVTSVVGALNTILDLAYVAAVSKVVGCQVAYATASTVTIAFGIARSYDYVIDIICGGVTVDITVAGAGGLDTGAEAVSTWYSVWVIADVAGVNPVVGMLSTAVDPGGITLPAGYTHARRVGWVRNDGSGDFLPFVYVGQNSDKVCWFDADRSDRSVISNGTAIVWAAVSVAALVPPSLQTRMVQLTLEHDAAFGDILEMRRGPATTGDAQGHHMQVFGHGTMTMDFPIDGQEFDYRLSSATGDGLSAWVAGFNDDMRLA